MTNNRTNIGLNRSSHTIKQASDSAIVSTTHLSDPDSDYRLFNSSPEMGVNAGDIGPGCHARNHWPQGLPGSDLHYPNISDSEQILQVPYTIRCLQE